MSQTRQAAPAAQALSGRDGHLDIKRVTLSNGMVVLVSENHTHPTVVLRLNLRAAPVLDEPARAGLASLTASALIRGTAAHSFEEINETIDAAGMGFSTGAGRHLATVSARCLTDDLALAIALMAEVAQQPTFPEDEVERLKGQVLTGLRQADNDTASVAERHFRELVYPPGHPYRLRSHGYLETVSPLTRDDLAAFHGTAYGPSGAFFVAVGDVDSDALVAQLEGAFGGWRAGSAPVVEVPDAPRPAATQQEYVVPGKTQCDLVLGLPAIRRDSPDYQPLRMANLIFGRLGMMGRLGETVREAQGLAYGVHSDLDAGIGAGPWTVRAGVNPVNVDQALEAIATELSHLTEQGVTDDELLRGKNYSTGSLVLHLETNDGVAGLVQEIEFFGLGLDYADRYPGIIQSLTKEQVNAAAARHLPRFEDTVRVIAGPARNP